jgi:hypothetical protein
MVNSFVLFLIIILYREKSWLQWHLNYWIFISADVTKNLKTVQNDWNLFHTHKNGLLYARAHYNWSAVHQSVDTTEVKRNLDRKQESSGPNLHSWCGGERRTAERGIRCIEICEDCSRYLPSCDWLRREMQSLR